MKKSIKNLLGAIGIVAEYLDLKLTTVLKIIGWTAIGMFLAQQGIITDTIVRLIQIFMILHVIAFGSRTMKLIGDIE